MKNELRLTYFDQAIHRMKSGEKLEEILASLPADAALIESIQVAYQLKKVTPAPNPLAQQSSKQAFLSAARKMTNSQNAVRFWDRLFGFRFATQLFIISIVLIASLTISGLVSAQSLPGQPLYNIKRTVEKMQLALTRDAMGKLQLEEVLDARRVNEVIRLQQSDKVQQVAFAGWLVQDETGIWSVQGIPLIMDQESPVWNALLNGSYIEVNGLSREDGILVRSLELRMFYLNGELQQNENGQWSINGVPIRVSSQSQLFSPLSNGLNVNATAIRLNTEEYLILVLSADDRARSGSTGQEDSLSPPGSFSDSNSTMASDDVSELETETLRLSTVIATITPQVTETSDDDELEQTPDSTTIPTSTADETTPDVDDTPEAEDTGLPESTPTRAETPDPTDTPEADG